MDDIITTAKVNDIIDMRLVPICEEQNWALGNSIFKKQFLQPNHNSSEFIQPDSLLAYTASSVPSKQYWPSGNDLA